MSRSWSRIRTFDGCAEAARSKSVPSLIPRFPIRCRSMCLAFTSPSGAERSLLLDDVLDAPQRVRDVLRQLGAPFGEEPPLLLVAHAGRDAADPLGGVTHAEVVRQHASVVRGHHLEGP